MAITLPLHKEAQNMIPFYDVLVDGAIQQNLSKEEVETLAQTKDVYIINEIFKGFTEWVEVKFRTNQQGDPQYDTAYDIYGHVIIPNKNTIYVDTLSNNPGFRNYRWSGTEYVHIIFPRVFIVPNIHYGDEDPYEYDTSYPHYIATDEEVDNEGPPLTGPSEVIIVPDEDSVYVEDYTQLSTYDYEDE